MSDDVSGASGPASVKWTSKYGSLVVSGYDAGTADGINETRLAANLLYLAESDYGTPKSGKPTISIMAWAQYVLDSYGSMAETVDALARMLAKARKRDADRDLRCEKRFIFRGPDRGNRGEVDALRAEPFTVIAPILPNGKGAQLHLAISDPTGDSAIFEYIGGKRVIHHDRKYQVMTNSPTSDEQLAIETYWKGVNPMAFLPGSIRTPCKRYRAARMKIKQWPRCWA